MAIACARLVLADRAATVDITAVTSHIGEIDSDT
jgi:hypothetical protein